MPTSQEIISEIRQNLLNTLPGNAAQLRMAPSHRGDLLKKVDEKDYRKSAVLIALFPDNGKICTVFIKRTSYNGVHSGQVGLPGGKYEKSDGTLIQTALREAHEEVGINPLDVEVLGVLTPLLIPVSNMEVQPVVGLLKEKPSFILDHKEVEFTIEVPICHLKNPKNQLQKTISVRGYSIDAPYFKVDCEDVWGATAMIIAEFIELFTCDTIA